MCVVLFDVLVVYDGDVIVEFVNVYMVFLLYDVIGDSIEDMY